MTKTFRYKGIKINAFGLPTTGEKHKNFSNKKSKRSYHKTFISPFAKNSPKNLIVMYDIPKDKNVERDWFRRQLQNFGYIMVQRSVWVGPSPLPKRFTSYLKSIELKDKLKTFKLAKPYKK